MGMTTYAIGLASNEFVPLMIAPPSLWLVGVGFCLIAREDHFAWNSFLEEGEPLIVC